MEGETGFLWFYQRSRDIADGPVLTSLPLLSGMQSLGVMAQVATIGRPSQVILQREVIGPYRQSRQGTQKREVDTLPKVTLEEAPLD